MAGWLVKLTLEFSRGTGWSPGHFVVCLCKVLMHVTAYHQKGEKCTFELQTGTFNGSRPKVHIVS